jgi:hypothetical protein
MNRITLAVVLCLLLFGLAAPAARADDIVLQDWTFNVNGDTNYNCTPWQGFPCTPDFPAFLSSAGFNFSTGVGTVSGTYNPGGPGAYYLIFYVDHDIVSAANNNPIENENGSTSGSPSAGLMWEIDDPGYFNDPNCTPATGGLVGDVLAGSLTNSAWPSTCGGPGDVAMALGWNFILGAGEVAHVSWTVSTTPPASGFYIHQQDPLSNQDLYFYGSLNITGGQTGVPEPATGVLFLLGSAFICAARRFRSKAS